MSKAVEVQNILMSKPDIETCEIYKTLKASRTGVVFLCMLNGQKVVVKLFRGPNVNNAVIQMSQELDVLIEEMGSGTYQVNRCIHAYPSDGLIVLSFARGYPLARLLNHAQGEERAELLRESAEWLQTFVKIRTSNAVFEPEEWLISSRTKDISHITDQSDLQMLEALLISMEKQASQIKGSPFLKAASHGDLSRHNLHYYMGTITGVDIEGTRWLPIAQEIAWFLIFVQVANHRELEETYWGIYDQDWKAFLSNGILPMVEQETTLPFFIGQQLYRAFVVCKKPVMKQELRHIMNVYLEQYKTDGMHGAVRG